MKKKLRTAAICVAAIVFLGSGAMVLYQQLQYRAASETYAEAEEMAGVPDLSGLSPLPPASWPEEPSVLPEEDHSETPAEEPVWVDPYADALAAMDFAALQEVNSDVLGWILIPGTPVSYPLLQGEDNSEYLNKTWRGNRNSVGAIFLECKNSGDLSDFNTIIYGHRMRNRSMFGSLKDYARQSYWESHPYVYITDSSGCRTYAIFAAYEVGVTEATYQLGGFDQEGRQAFLDFCTAQSVIETGILPTTEDHILTLSTCTGTGHEKRWVVQAVQC